MLQVGVERQRAVGRLLQELTVAGRDHEQPPVRKPVDAERKRWSVNHDLAVAFEIEGDHLLRAPVGEPQAVLVPARLLAEDDAAHQDAWF